MSIEIERPRPLVAQFSKPFSLVVEQSQALSACLAACRYGWINQSVRKGLFCAEENQDGRYEAMYLSANRGMRDVEVERVVACEGGLRPWKLGTFQHLLADAAIENEVNRVRPVAALGSVARVGSDNYYAYSYLGGEKRVVGIQLTSMRWLENVSFLVVRRVL